MQWARGAGPGPFRAPGPPRALACVTNACDELFFQLNSFTQSVFQVTFQIPHWRKDDIFNQIGTINPRNLKRQPLGWSTPPPLEKQHMQGGKNEKLLKMQN